jgi:hypothetical protein
MRAMSARYSFSIGESRANAAILARTIDSFRAASAASAVAYLLLNGIFSYVMYLYKLNSFFLVRDK